MFKHVILCSCNDLPQGSPSGYYHIETSNRFIQVYCDTNLKKCSCNASGGWIRVANLDMTDPTQQCPDGFKLINRTEPDRGARETDDLGVFSPTIHSGMVRDVGVPALAVSSTIHHGSVSNSLSQLLMILK